MWTHSRVVCMKMGKEALRRGEETGKEREAGTGREERSQGGEGKRARGSREERGGEDPGRMRFPTKGILTVSL